MTFQNNDTNNISQELYLLKIGASYIFIIHSQ